MQQPEIHQYAPSTSQGIIVEQQGGQYIMGGQQVQQVHQQGGYINVQQPMEPKKAKPKKPTKKQLAEMAAQQAQQQPQMVDQHGRPIMFVQGSQGQQIQLYNDNGK